MPNGVFREFNREQRPLSFHLRQRFLAPLLRQVEQLPSEELQGDLDDLTRRLVDQIRVEPPVLQGQEAASARDGEPRPTDQPGVRRGTTRFFTAVQVDGDVELLEHWPDQAEHVDQLHPVDEEMDPWTSIKGPGGGASAAEYDPAAQLRWHEAVLAQDRWTVGQRTDAGPAALYTFIDLTDDEAEQVERQLRDPAEEVSAALERVRPIVVAIEEQTRRFFDHDLPALLAEQLRLRRRKLGARQAVLASLTFPVGWKYPEPALEPLPKQAAQETGAAVEVTLGQPTRLADASFSDLLRTLRVWADAVERHPLAYRTLPEERVSDLIAATLNAALPGAHREVFNRGGKTDLFVRADTLSSGAAPARIFICECKWWGGAQEADRALDQLFGYLNAQDTAAVLLFLVRLRDPRIAHAEALRVLQAREEYVDASAEQVLGWPVLRFNRDGTTARVCVVFVDLPDLEPVLPAS